MTLVNAFVAIIATLVLVAQWTDAAVVADPCPLKPVCAACPYDADPSLPCPPCGCCPCYDPCKNSLCPDHMKPQNVSWRDPSTRRTFRSCCICVCVPPTCPKYCVNRKIYNTIDVNGCTVCDCCPLETMPSCIPPSAPVSTMDANGCITNFCSGGFAPGRK